MLSKYLIQALVFIAEHLLHIKSLTLSELYHKDCLQVSTSNSFIHL